MIYQHIETVSLSIPQNSDTLFDLLNKDIESLHEYAMRDIYPIFNNENPYDISPVR